VLAIGLCVAACGCRTLGGRRGTTAESVAVCRQLTDQGISAMERGDWKRAESLFARAVETSAVDADARRHYAETLVHRGALGEARTQLEEARRLANTDPAIAVRLGEVDLALAQPQAAMGMANEALGLDPKFAPAWTLRGRVAGAAGQPRQALADFQRSLGYAPDNLDVPVLVAETYRQLNEPERALLTLQSVADNYPPGGEPQRVLYLAGLAQMALGRYDEAAASLSQAAERDRPTPAILCELAEAQLRSGNPTQAQASVQEALALDPNHAPSRALSARMAMAAPAAGAVAR
jgi:tetratricopeptide (TPR) repeat protein